MYANAGSLSKAHRHRLKRKLQDESFGNILRWDRHTDYHIQKPMDIDLRSESDRKKYRDREES